MNSALSLLTTDNIALIQCNLKLKQELKKIEMASTLNSIASVSIPNQANSTASVCIPNHANTTANVCIPVTDNPHNSEEEAQIRALWDDEEEEWLSDADDGMVEVDEVVEPMFHNSWSDLEYSDEDEDLRNEFKELRNQHQPS